jgi:hypothetical protein
MTQFAEKVYVLFYNTVFFKKIILTMSFLCFLRNDLFSVLDKYFLIWSIAFRQEGLMKYKDVLSKTSPSLMV